MEHTNVPSNQVQDWTPETILHNYSDAYIIVDGIINDTGTAADVVTRQTNKINKQVIFKNCVHFTDCLEKINNKQEDNAKGLYVVMAMYNLIECSHNYAKISENVRQYYKDDLNNNITDSESFKFKEIITATTAAGGKTKYIEIAVPLKCLSNVWRTREMLPIDCKINLMLTWLENCVITNATGAGTFKITDTKLCLPVVTL